MGGGNAKLLLDCAVKKVLLQNLLEHGIIVYQDFTRQNTPPPPPPANK